jgi:hypothetical protein
VKGCAFRETTSCPGIIVETYVTITGCCFARDGVSIDSKENGFVIFGADNSFHGSREVGSLAKIEVDLESFSTSGCTEWTVDTNKEDARTHFSPTKS